MKKDLSVYTPSVQKTRAHSYATSDFKSFHMANPNPQDHAPKFKGVREAGYTFYKNDIDPTDVIRFGKRVNYNKRDTVEDVMEEHLRQMRNKMEQQKVTKDMKRQ